jgi:heat shock protein HslJ
MTIIMFLFVAFLAACDGAAEEPAEELEPPLTLVGTAWMVTAFDDGSGEMVDVLESTEITANFSRETPNAGMMSGFGGCNEYETDYDIAGEYVGIGIDRAITTQKICAEPEGVMEQETAYVEALRTSRKWKIDGLEMVFTGAEDKVVMAFSYTGEAESTGGDEEFVVPPGGIEFTYTFDEDEEGWIAGFADLPADRDDAIYELDSEWRELPDDLGGYGIYIQGHNRSDDLFMFLKREIDGLEPGAAYQATFRLVLASDVPPGMSGVGGSPGESVYVKVGATSIEPLVEEDPADGWLRMNIDKGNQANGGEDMIVIGDMANSNLAPETVGSYELMERNSSGLEFEVTAGDDGTLWFIVGTDSGFEGLTTLYYDTITVVLEQQ